MRARQLLFGVVLVASALLLVELGVRIVFSFAAGRSLLLYGFGDTGATQKRGMLFPTGIDRANWHEVFAADDREKAFVENAAGDYSKYHPHQFKRNRDEYGHISEIRINNLGFRGDDVSIEKPDGTYRVLTLGASSTFGYRNRDHETYPYYLEAELSERLSRLRRFDPDACGDVQRFEVINFGIPHLNASHIKALLLAEGLPLDPDAVTYYEGANETRLIEPGALQKTLSVLGHRLMLVRFLHSVVRDALSSFDAAEVNRHLDGVSEHFLAELAEIADACSKAHVALLVASQQARSFLVPNEEMAGVSYTQEVDLVRRKLARTDRISLKEMVFLMHAALMEDLRSWSTRPDVRFVDVAAALDSQRDGLISWVHLTAAANRTVARSLAPAILDEACSVYP